MRSVATLSVVLGLAGASCTLSTDLSLAADEDFDVIAALEERGAEVGELGTVSGDPLSVPARLLSVNGDTLWAYEYASTAEAIGDRDAFSGDGSRLRRAGSEVMITWIRPPHFFHRERWIALYLGSDDEMLELLRTAIGPQFAGLP